MTQREVLSPYDGSVVGAVDCADEAAVEEALTTAYALYRDRRAWLPTHERVPADA